MNRAYNQGRAEDGWHTPRETFDIPTTDCPECENGDNGCHWCDHTGTVEMLLCELCDAYECQCDAAYEQQAEK